MPKHREAEVAVEMQEVLPEVIDIPSISHVLDQFKQIVTELTESKKPGSVAPYFFQGCHRQLVAHMKSIIESTDRSTSEKIAAIYDDILLKIPSMLIDFHFFVQKGLLTSSGAMPESVRISLLIDSVDAAPTVSAIK